ncbi:hypothetical protein M3672_10125 [Microbacterium enclense]|uniref:phosphotransferase n=1 Tax=Microbacterium enclense TaxID=993073 RepID=UPI00203AC65E|nr:phosphotransferase [Microbacterium enclense]MCM3614790.1 hypothetical protein [Microbacterium enclense]
MSAAFPVRDAIDETLVKALVREQLPEWAGLSVAAVRESGNDHRTFRLGDGLVARLPADLGFVPQVAKEQKYLPFLAPHLPVPVPTVAGVGRESTLFPAPWSVYGWLDGIRPDAVRVRDDAALAESSTGLSSAGRRGASPATCSTSTMPRGRAARAGLCGRG